MSENNQNQPQESKDLLEVNKVFSDYIKFIRDLIIILLFVFWIRSFIITPFQITGSSMENNYHHKEVILVDIFSYLNFSTHFDEILANDPDVITKTVLGTLKKIPIHIGDPKRGDVVVIKPHVDEEHAFYLKRVIGLPWETIRIQDGKVAIKQVGKEDFIELKEEYLSITNRWHTYLPTNIVETEFLIPEGTYWVMGDNRLVSADSRWCFLNACFHKNSSHFLKRGDVVGKVFIDFGYFNIFKENEFPKLGELRWIHTPKFFNISRTAEYPELEETKIQE